METLPNSTGAEEKASTVTSSQTRSECNKFFGGLLVVDPGLTIISLLYTALISNMKVLCTCPWPMLDPIPSKCIETNLSMSRSSSFPCRGAHVPIFVLLRVPVRTYLTILPVDRSSSSRL